MFTPKGQFGWYELMTSDTQAVGKFYADVVGWTTQEMPNPVGGAYTTFHLEEVGMAGMLKPGLSRLLAANDAHLTTIKPS